ncbi:MAG: hypothetical protein ACI8W7_004778 [Gammaproteobacteria bacterium]|jgi:hypothetical protein
MVLCSIALVRAASLAAIAVVSPTIADVYDDELIA